jgi:glycosyltransferase involved in cell wall biosynthesis
MSSDLRLRSVFTAHGWAFNESNRSSLSRFIYYIGHYLTILLCNATIAVSEKAKKDIAWLPLIKNKVKVIYNGIRKFKTKSKKEARQILTGEESKKTIVFSVSELHHNKGIDIALKAIARLPKNLREKVIYCIAGNGEKKSHLEQLANGMNISQNVRFLGFVPNAKELFAGADIFLLPSRTEALPYCLLEAGLAGTPVVAASVGGIPEIISDMQDGILVHPRNPREIAEAIGYLMENPDKKKMFREKIKEMVASKFTLEKMFSQTYSLYKYLLSNT